MSSTSFFIDQRKVGGDAPCFIIAEMSANHCGSFELAMEIVERAAECGADAIKLQTYLPESLTINSNKHYFQISNETLWGGKNLYQLYHEAHMPWEWHAPLFKKAKELGLICFSSPFDLDGVKLLAGLNAPAYKIASFEAIHGELIQAIAQQQKPVILSTGMCKKDEIDHALKLIHQAGVQNIGLLKCTSAYPATHHSMNLKTIQDYQALPVVPGLSDHSIGSTAAITAVTLGAKIIEKHFVLDRNCSSPDGSFSMTPSDFRFMVDSIREAEVAVGEIEYGPTHQEKCSVTFRRSIFAVQNIKKGELFSDKNIRVIRPGHGLHPKYLNQILGQKANQDIEVGEPLTLSDLSLPIE
jgi:pseudaminic acid synthase